MIQKIKTAWRSKWDAKRMDMVNKQDWVDCKNGSGNWAIRLNVFLRVAAEGGRDVSDQRDSIGFYPKSNDTLWSSV